jgi:hypothetical protein
MENKKLTTFFADYADFLGKDFIAGYGYEFPEIKSSTGLFSKSDFNKLLEEIKFKEKK